jgi:hypothetical protein
MHRVQSSGLPKTANPGVQGQTVGKSLPGDLSVAGEQFPVTRTRGPDTRHHVSRFGLREWAGYFWAAPY